MNAHARRTAPLEHGWLNHSHLMGNGINPGTHGWVEDCWHRFGFGLIHRRNRYQQHGLYMPRHLWRLSYRGCWSVSLQFGQAPLLGRDLVSRADTSSP